jgi:sugar phosphate isomerase/epimerase
MNISVATANFYFLPFEETLELIAEAGFHNIELDLFWEWNDWAMAQHLQHMPVSQAIKSVHGSGLKVTSIHDTGGVLSDRNSLAGYINPQLDEYLDQLGYAPEYLVFHTPHAPGAWDADWWAHISGDILRALDPYRAFSKHLTLENMPYFEGFAVPLTTPEELHAFVTANNLEINLDTTHYALMGVDIKEAAGVLNGTIRSVHLSDYVSDDYASDRAHVFIGEGELDLAGFVSLLDPAVINTVTLECSVSTADRSDKQMSHAEILARMQLLRATTVDLLGGS